jgi:hypothetical protein
LRNLKRRFVSEDSLSRLPSALDRGSNLDWCTLSKLEQAVGNRLRSALTFTTGILLSVGTCTCADCSALVGIDCDVAAHCSP